MENFKELGSKVLESIDNYCKQAYNSGFRKHLGASVIGGDCPRAIWYAFRWVKKIEHDGRLLRLFNRGHREEERFVEWLRGIGCKVWETDQNGEQFKISDIEGHFGGSLDGVCILPESFNYLKPLLLEFKTIGKTQLFQNLVDNGVKLAYPKYYTQISHYGSRYNFEHCLFMAIRKETDEIYIEFVKIDKTECQDSTERARYIITSQEAPKKLSNTPAFYKCKFCDYSDVCHKGKTLEVNCRSCKHAVPWTNKTWKCYQKNSIIDEYTIYSGCDDWEPIA